MKIKCKFCYIKNLLDLDAYKTSKNIKEKKPIHTLLKIRIG